MGCTFAKKPPITRKSSTNLLPQSNLSPKFIDFKHARCMRKCPNNHTLKYLPCGLYTLNLLCKRCNEIISQSQFYYCESCESKDFYCMKCIQGNPKCDHNKETILSQNNWETITKYTKIIPVCDLCKKYSISMYECKECSFYCCLNCSQIKVALTGKECYPHNDHFMVKITENTSNPDYKCMACGNISDLYECSVCDSILCKLCLFMEIHLQCPNSANQNHTFQWKKSHETTKVCTFFHTSNYLTNTGYACKDCGWFICELCIGELQKTSFAVENELLKSAKKNLNCEQKTTDTERQNSNNDEKLLCKICYEEKSLATFVPCGHQGICFDCSKYLRECPVCCTRIQQSIKTFVI